MTSYKNDSWLTLSNHFVFPDIDECEVGVQEKANDPPCDLEASVCVNLPGTFECPCFQGYKNIAPPQPYGKNCRSELQILRVHLILCFWISECCEDIDECADSKLNDCSDICDEGLAPRPLNYTCKCNSNRFLDGPITCCKKMIDFEMSDSSFYQKRSSRKMISISWDILLIIQSAFALPFTVDCAFENWGLYGPCNVTCGLGTLNRTREVRVGFGEKSPECNDRKYTMSFLSCMGPPCSKWIA